MPWKTLHLYSLARGTHLKERYKYYLFGKLILFADAILSFKKSKGNKSSLGQIGKENSFSWSMKNIVLLN